MRHNSAQIQVRLATLAGLIGFLWVAGCGGDDGSHPAAHANTRGDGSAGGAATSGAAVSGQCQRASGLDGPGAPRDSCKSAAAYLRCEFSGGVTGLCLSDDATRCPDNASVIGTLKGCQNQCKPNEYAVSCGGIGPNIGNAAPPAGCRSLGVTPGGPGFHCCPCL